MNSKRESPRVCILLLGTCLLWISAAYSQSGRRLEGKVLDESGGWIPGATVTLYSDDRVRTTLADGDGNFVFVGLSAPAHYLEASSKGFICSSSTVADPTLEPISITLHVGSCDQCTPLADVRDHSIRYEERSGREQLVGSVSEFSGPHLPKTRLNLMKAEAETTGVSAPGRRSPVMSERTFKYTFALEIFSDEKGEFRLVGLEPGWYSLQAVHEGYQDEMSKFWIARETLTRPARIELAREGPGQPSPFRPVTEIPLSPAPLPELPVAPHRE